jgi:ribosomal subunit interface protein
MRIIQMKGTNMDLTEAIKKHIEDRVDSLRKLCAEFDPADELRVEVGKSTKHHSKGPYFRAEFQLHVPGKDMRAVEEGEDLYTTIDKVRDSIKRQLTDYKNVLKDRAQRAARPGKE